MLSRSNLLWFSVRVYALGLTAFIAAFGAFRWRVPGYRQRYARPDADATPAVNRPDC